MQDLSIIILHHNQPEKSKDALESLNKASLPQKTKIWLINNGGNNANNSISAQKYPNLNITFKDIKNTGYPAGNNYGLSLCKAQNYIFLNPDIVVEKDTIKKLLNYFKNNPKVGIIAPRLQYPDETIQDNYRVFPKFLDLLIKRIKFLRTHFPERMRRYLMWDKEPNINEAVDWVTGAFMMISNQCLQSTGNHDEYFFLFMSDLCLCREAWNKNYEVHFLGQAKALHNDQRLSSGGIKDIFKKKTLQIHIIDTLKYYKKYFFKKMPSNCPSLKYTKRKDRLAHSKKLKTASLKGINKKLQKKNPYITVFSSKISGEKTYEQPIIFFNTGVIVILKENHKIGLRKKWRHVPLSFNKKNTFPILPETIDLGMWSLELPRFNLESNYKNLEQSTLLYLEKKFNIKRENIIEINHLNKIIDNTALSVGSHQTIEVNLQNSEKLNDISFHDLNDIKKLIKEDKIFCSLSQSAILQSLENKNDFINQ